MFGIGLITAITTMTANKTKDPLFRGIKDSQNILLLKPNITTVSELNLGKLPEFLRMKKDAPDGRAILFSAGTNEQPYIQVGMHGLDDQKIVAYWIIAISKKWQL